MSSIKNITIIGSGRVAWHLAQAFYKAGYTIDQIYGRNQEATTEIATLVNAKVKSDPDFTDNTSEIFIIAVGDQNIGQVVDKLLIPDKAIVAHTSGSLEMSVLNKFSRHGVFYPLQTFTKGKAVDITQIPFGIEASDTFTQNALSDLALSLSKNVVVLSSHQRRVLHIAAVFACNFTNHLFLVAENILKKEHLDFRLLEPLIKETLDKSLTIGPAGGQTGPAIRGDEKIIREHLDYLKNEPEIQRLYELITEGIKRNSVI